MGIPRFHRLCAAGWRPQFEDLLTFAWLPPQPGASLAVRSRRQIRRIHIYSPPHREFYYHGHQVNAIDMAVLRMALFTARMKRGCLNRTRVLKQADQRRMPPADRRRREPNCRRLSFLRARCTNSAGQH
jgi:hypothetical protein